MRLTRILLVITLLAGALPALAGGAPPDLTGDGLDRGALLALPSVYRVEVTFSARSVVTADRETRVRLTHPADVWKDVGTAFAVGSNGTLVTAWHVVKPDVERLAVRFLERQYELDGVPEPEKAAQDFVERTDAKAEGVETVAIDVRQADAGAGGQASRRFSAQHVVRGTADFDRTVDLALLRIRGAGGAPTLPVRDEPEPGTPIVTIGFGRDSAFEDRRQAPLRPTVRRGTTGEHLRLSRLSGDLIRVSADVEPGDSGGPAVDRDGRVVGVVLLRLNAGGGAIEPVASVVRLLDQYDVPIRPSETSDAFRRGVDHLRRLEFSDARAQFERTLRLYPHHTLAEVEGTRAEALQDARFELATPGRRQGVLTAVGVTSGLLALACGLGLARRRRPAAAGPRAGAKV